MIFIFFFVLYPVFGFPTMKIYYFCHHDKKHNFTQRTIDQKSHKGDFYDFSGYNLMEADTVFYNDSGIFPCLSFESILMVIQIWTEKSVPMSLFFLLY